MNEQKEKIYFKKNVPYRVGVRSDLRDTIGQVLTNEFPYVEVYQQDLRNFLLANKYAIKNGLILEIDEPPMETFSINTISDEQAIELVKNVITLRKKLVEITSEAAVLKLLEAARAGKKEKAIKAIMERYEDISPNAPRSVT